MRLVPLLAAGLFGLTLSAGASRAEAPPSPLRLIPAEADLYVQVREPAKLADLILKLDVLPGVLNLAAVKEQLDSTSVRRARQLLAYFEKSLGCKWPELLDRLAGGGVALGSKFVGNNAPALLVVQGKDEKLLKQFVDLAAALIESELARQESKDKLEKRTHEGIDAYQVGGGFFMARAGTTLIVANKKDALARAVQLYLGKEKKSLLDNPDVRDAGKLMGKDPLAELWVSMKPAQASQAGKDLYKSPRDNFILTVLAGGYIDLFGRTPYFCAGLHKEEDGYLLSLRAPRGREGMSADGNLHVPPAGQGTRPLLEPKGVLYSTSFYFDFASIWKDRDRLFPKTQADGLTQADKNAKQPPLNMRISKLLEAIGARHRIVVANQAKPSYKRVPKVTIPAFAFVAEARDANRIGLAVDTGLRALALVGTNQFGMKLTEEKHGDVELVGYRFDEAKEVPDDVNDIRFAFSPCWARVGNEFLFCSTMDLARELIDQLKAESKSPGKQLTYRSHDRSYAAGLADLLAGVEDQLVTQAILDQAVDAAEAKRQVRQFIALVRGLGKVTSYSDFGEKTWRYEFRFGK
jgi:hypothetical protein